MVQLIEVKNIATRVTADQVTTILSAVQDQVNEDVVPVWECGPVQITQVASNADWTKGGWRFLVADSPGQVGQAGTNDLGDHDQAGGAPTGYAFVGPTLDAGMEPSVTISHEIIEMIGDPLIDQYCLWSDVPNSLFLAQELCDPVEDDSLAYRKNNILVSNFVTPAYFVPNSAGPWDFGGKLTSANMLGTQGYQLRWDPTNGLSQYWGNGPARGRAAPSFASVYSRRMRRVTKTQQRTRVAAFAKISPNAVASAVKQPWGWLTAAFVAAIVACGVWLTRSAWSHYPFHIIQQWLAVEAALIGLCMWAGYIVNGRLDGILIDEQNRMSLERTQWVAWFIVLLGGYFTEAVWDSALAQPFPYMQSDLFVLLGIVSGSAVTSGVIADAKKKDRSAPPPPANPRIGTPTQKGAVDANVSPSEASFADLYLGVEVADRDTVDVSRLQKLVITALLLITYVQQLVATLSATAVFAVVDHKTMFVGINSLPTMPAMDSSRLWLLGISHAAFLAAKAAPKTATTPSAQAPGG